MKDFDRNAAAAPSLHDPQLTKSSLVNYIRGGYHAQELAAYLILGVNAALAQVDTGTETKAFAQSRADLVDDCKIVIRAVAREIDEIRFIDDVQDIVERLPLVTKEGQDLKKRLYAFVNLKTLHGPEGAGLTRITQGVFDILKQTSTSPLAAVLKTAVSANGVIKGYS